MWLRYFSQLAFALEQMLRSLSARQQTINDLDTMKNGEKLGSLEHQHVVDGDKIEHKNWWVKAYSEKFKQ